MKKRFAVLWICILVLALTGCKKTQVQQPDPTQPSVPQATPAPTPTPEDKPDDTPTVTDNPALTVMLGIWEQFEGDKDVYIGGSSTDYRLATPWQVPLSDKDFLQGALFLSEEQIPKVKAAASLMHSLNTNNLTVGAVSLEEDVDFEAFATEVKDRILQNQWVCGRPGGLRILKVESCLLILYGSGSYSGSFVDALNEAYPEAEVLCRETI